MAGREKKYDYTPEQLKEAEQAANLLASVPKDKKNILVTMTNVFVSGMEAGLQLSLEKSNLKK